MKNFFRYTLRLPKDGMPFWMTGTILIVLSALLIVPAFIYWQRNNFSAQPRVHIFQGMDNQPKYKAQSPASVFADQRAMRAPVPGTVARGEVLDDDHYLRGYGVVSTPQGDRQTVFFEGMPQRIREDWFSSDRRAQQFLALGEKKFNIYCYTCHGKNGAGNGPTHYRAQQLMQANAENATWVQPANLVQIQDGQMRFGSELYPDGQLYNTIMLGKNNMAGYGHQLGPENGWAVVAYVRALQLSQYAPVDALDEDQRDQLPLKNTAGQSPGGTSQSEPTPADAPSQTASPDLTDDAEPFAQTPLQTPDRSQGRAEDLDYTQGYQRRQTDSGIAYRSYVSDLPQRIVQTHFADAASAEAFFVHGRETFDATCTSCHTLDDGMIPVGTRGGYAGGRLFDQMVKGGGEMEGLGDLLSIDDRWAVVAYLRSARREGGEVIEATPQQAFERLAPRP